MKLVPTTCMCGTLRCIQIELHKRRSNTPAYENLASPLTQAKRQRLMWNKITCFLCLGSIEDVVLNNNKSTAIQNSLAFMELSIFCFIIIYHDYSHYRIYHFNLSLIYIMLKFSKLSHIKALDIEFWVFLYNTSFTVQKMKFSIKDVFSKCDQTRSFRSFRSFLQIWSHLLKESLMENFIFCVVIFMFFLYFFIMFTSLINFLLYFLPFIMYHSPINKIVWSSICHYGSLGAVLTCYFLAKF